MGQARNITRSKQDPTMVYVMVTNWRGWSFVRRYENGRKVSWRARRIQAAAASAPFPTAADDEPERRSSPAARDGEG